MNGAYRDYLQSPEWAVVRRLALEQADHACRLCGGRDGLDVHHRTYERLGQERLADVIVLCRDCHSRFHDRTMSDDPRATEADVYRAAFRKARQTAQGLRETALLAMCIANPREGQEVIEIMAREIEDGALPPPDVITAATIRYVAEHLVNPLEALDLLDEAAADHVRHLVRRAGREPGSREAMAINLAQLRVSVLDARISRSRRLHEEPPVELQRQRAELLEDIAQSDWNGSKPAVPAAAG